MSVISWLLLALSLTIFLQSQLLFNFFFLYEMLTVTFLQQVLIAIICMGLILNFYKHWVWNLVLVAILFCPTMYDKLERSWRKDISRCCSYLKLPGSWNQHSNLLKLDTQKPFSLFQSWQKKKKNTALKWCWILLKMIHLRLMVELIF